MLKLDAEWVILSACNTAGGAGQGEAAEALSGLARVFFYAGARALLVSHWEVDSAATVNLITTALGALAKDKSLGRAEALGRAICCFVQVVERRLETRCRSDRPWLRRFKQLPELPFIEHYCPIAMVGPGGMAPSVFTIDGAERADIRILDRVFGVIPVLQDPVRQVVAASRCASTNCPKRGRDITATTHPSEPCRPFTILSASCTC